MPVSLEQALARARAGDPVAFNQLVDAYQTDAYHVAYHHLGNVDDALDACQEAMLSAWRAVGTFEGDTARFRRWLLTIVVNACHDRYRYERRRPQEPIERESDGESWALPLPDPGQTPDEYAQSADLGRLLHQALTQLSEDHRVVVLLDHAGFNYAEIAEAIDVEVGTVKSRLSRARGHMRDLLAGRVPLRPPTEPDDESRRSPTMRRSPMRGTPERRTPERGNTPTQEGPDEHVSPGETAS